MKQAHATTFKELLSTSFVEGSGTANGPVDTKKETAKTNKQVNIAAVLDLAVKASVAVNTKQASKLFNICAAFALASKEGPKTTVPESNVGTLYTSVIKPKDTSKTKRFEAIELGIPISKRPADIVPGVVMLNNNARPLGEDIGFIPFFEKNLRDLHGLLPLTIFNTIWQAKAINHHTLNLGKKAKSDNSGKDKTRYLEYKYPKELRQTYAEWSINHQDVCKESDDGRRNSLKIDKRLGVLRGCSIQFQQAHAQLVLDKDNELFSHLRKFDNIPKDKFTVPTLDNVCAVLANGTAARSAVASK
ncbi:hypothetical protein H4Q26_003004 [Puccinia striiformis f. sp. tritici PST-130]|nr:hypothetical protein H4Q26_003004 [Puccinia striiformis f. sp. tritici PST-130]